MTVKTLANTRLNMTISAKPKPTRCRLMAPNMSTKAEGQGSSPPEMPKASKLRQVIACSGLASSTTGGRW